MENKKGLKPKQLMSVLDSVSAKVKNEPKLQRLQTSKQTLTYEQLLEDPAQVSCRNGSIFGMNTSPLKDAYEKCRKLIVTLKPRLHYTALLPVISPPGVYVKAVLTEH